MAGVVIETRPNGPYVVCGAMRLVDVDGHVIDLPEDSVVTLCRCGHSGTKPFCDSSHRRVDFVSRPLFHPEPVPEPTER